MENRKSQPAQVDAPKPRSALECGDLSPLSPLGGLVHQAAPRLAARAEGDTHDLDGDKSPAQSDDQSPHSKSPWPHAPVHRMSEHGVYFVTAGTLHKVLLFRDGPRLDLLEFKLLTLAETYHWQIEAWACFTNHYHLVCRGNSDSADLGKYLKHLHADTARELNRLDQREGRQVWHNFRETKPNCVL